MYIANIYPIANQEAYHDEKLVMILAHLLKKNLYDCKNFLSNQYVIMDNGLFEKQQISTRLYDVVDLALKSNISVSEIIVPDAINNLDKTIELFESNLPTIKEFRNNFCFMFVAQAISYGELRKAIQYINQYQDMGLNLTVGISKLTPLNRADDRAIRCYRQCKFPIHFLGLKESFSELDKVASWIRSCDSSQLAFIAKNEQKRPESVWNYYRDGQDIDLEKDKVDENKLDMLKAQMQIEGYRSGIL